MDIVTEVERYLQYRPETVRVHDNVDDFFDINRGDVVVLDGRYFLISGIARERSFGLDDEPKHWVKYAYEVSTGKRKIIKLVFMEQFDLKYGGYVIRCFRSPAKEGRALEAVWGNPNFMQGCTAASERNKEVRIIDHIAGKPLYSIVEDFGGSHEAYFHEMLPSILRLLVPALKALACLHDAGIRHGDIRTDHLMLDKETGHLRWIDFDYDFIFEEAPFALDLIGVGHVLSELIGKGLRTIHNLRAHRNLDGAIGSMTPADFSLVEPRRPMNWKKLYPYVPEKLNRISMHFAAGAEIYYESVSEIVEDLGDALESMPPAHTDKNRLLPPLAKGDEETAR
ncbi:MAG: protein kinase [Candidatus Lindowbacteria bacterium]|nr:protein kinase [Candidatus Lindowbacteria bacterium]